MSKSDSRPGPGSVLTDVVSPPKRRPKIIGLGVIAVGLLVVLVNALAGSTLRSVRIDLTEEKLYSLSPAVGSFLKGIEEPIQVQLFISRGSLSNLPQYRAYATRVEEFLTEMERVSDGNLQLTVLNPEPYSEAEDLARTLGLEQVNSGQIGQTLVLGLMLSNTVDQREVMPFLDPAQEPTLEYDLMRAISGLARPEKPRVGLISPLEMAGKAGPRKRPQEGRPPHAAYLQMQQIFSVQTIDRLADELPEDLDALVMVHPAGLTDGLLHSIDAYVHQGGKLVLFYDPQHESLPTATPGTPRIPVTSDVGDLLEAWGVSVNHEEVVADPTYAQRIQTQGGGSSGAPMLSWLGLSSEAMSDDTPITRSLRFVILASAGRIARLDTASQSLVITPLFESSTESGLVDSITTGKFGDPQAIMSDHSPSGERYVMAARLTGPVERAYPKPRIDADAEISTDAPDAMGDNATESSDQPGDEPAAEPVQDLPPGKDADIVLVADADMLADRFWIQESYRGPQPVADNGAFLLSTLEVLTGNPVLSGLRPRAASRRPFTRIEKLQREAEAEFLSEVERLQDEVKNTEQRLNQLLQQAPSDNQTLTLNSEQQAEIEKLQDQRLATRKALRVAQYELSRSIDRLGQVLMLINVVAWPALISLILAAGLALRWKRSRALD